MNKSDKREEVDIEISLLCFCNLIEISFNQPKLPSNGCWNPQAITSGDQSPPRIYPRTVFVDRNSTVYAVDQSQNRIHMWPDNGSNMSKTIFNTLSQPVSLFVTIDGSIFVGGQQGTVEKWTSNTNKSVVVTEFSSGCSALFIDAANDIYCSMTYENRVIKQSLLIDRNISITIAGTGTSGSSSNELRYPQGIFVDINFDLYVADCGNNRVQLFQSGQMNGTTIVGNLETLGITLNCPTAVFLDADKYLFIVDQGNNRIIRSNSNGFECVAGCSGRSGSAANELSHPVAAAFDPYGNIFVLDAYNSRIQKFIFMSNTSGK